MGNMPRNPLSRGGFESLVAGLRTEAPPSEVRVYKANPDGTVGELLRIEYPSAKWRKHERKTTNHR